MHSSIIASGNPMAQMVESACNTRDLGSISGLGRSFGERNSNTHQYSCLEKFHGQRSLAVYSPWGPKESDRTERLTLFSFIGELRSCTLHGVAKRKKKFIHSFCKCLLNIWCFIYCPQH